MYLLYFIHLCKRSYVTPIVVFCLQIFIGIYSFCLKKEKLPVIAFFTKSLSNANQLQSLAKQAVLIQLQKLKPIICVYLTVTGSL